MEILKLLLDHGADPNLVVQHLLPAAEITVEHEVRCPLLSHAIEHGRSDIALSLIADQRTDTSKAGVTIMYEERGVRLAFHPNPATLAQIYGLGDVCDALSVTRETPCEKAEHKPQMKTRKKRAPQPV